ncbi:hypothetical protein UFOVP253_25 [uncultured Caudovirales phage]|uniref:Uncharacterized protein n=1 Tax=uncultured Caudovirales phage TaxID=2100421 RepID=A0A6J5LFZ9_9CAUD|nr:hypothetical protein UFOVP253_25 [uncultured Caudovirales phage]
MDIVHTIINYLTAHWGAILALTGGSAGLSALTELIIQKAHVDSKKVAYTLVHFLSFASGIVAYVAMQDNAVGVYATLVIGAQTIHRFLLSPAYVRYIEPYLQYKANQKPASEPVPAPAPAPEFPTQ